MSSCNDLRKAKTPSQLAEGLTVPPDPTEAHNIGDIARQCSNDSRVSNWDA